MSQTPGYQRFFAELKRRRVFRVAAVYGGSAFVVLQVADVVAEGLNLSPGALQAVTLLILAGFPIALALAWAFQVTPEGLRRTDPATPADLDAIVAQPRGQRWPAGILGLLGGLAIATAGWWALGPRQAAEETPAGESTAALAEPADVYLASLAVLPFANRSDNPENEYFTDGVHDDILTELSRLEDLKLISRTSVMRYRDTETSIREIGQELGVATVLEGSVQRSGERVRITVQLIDADTDNHLWAETYDQELTAANVFAIQSDVARQIATALEAALVAGGPAESRPPRPRAWRPTTGSRKRGSSCRPATRRTCAGLWIFTRRRSPWTPATPRRTRGSPRRTWSCIPGTSSRWSRSSRLSSPRWIGPWRSIRCWARPTLRAHCSCATWASSTNRRGTGGGPSSSFRGTPTRATGTGACCGRSADSTSRGSRCAAPWRSIPCPAIISTNVGFGEYFARDYEAAIAQYRRALDRYPDFSYTWILLSLAYSLNGQHEEALEAGRTALEISPGDLNYTPVLAFVVARAGDEAEARRLMESVTGSDPTRLALAHVALGETDEALRLVELAVDEGSPFRAELGDPAYDPIRAEPRFQEAMRRVGLID